VEPEKPRRLIGPDLVAAILLLALGVGSIAAGIALRSQLGRDRWHLPEIGVVVTVAGLAALRWGVSRSLAYLPLFGFEGEDEDFPTILWALPFFVFGMACFTTAVFGLADAKGHSSEVFGEALIATAVGSIGLSLLVIIGIAVGRAARALWRALGGTSGDGGDHS